MSCEYVVVDLDVLPTDDGRIEADYETLCRDETPCIPPTKRISKLLDDLRERMPFETNDDWWWGSTPIISGRYVILDVAGGRDDVFDDLRQLTLSLGLSLWDPGAGRMVARLAADESTKPG